MKSRRPYWCPKTLKRRPCWCPSSPVGVELFSYVKTFFCSNKFAWMLVGEHALDKPCYYRKTQWRVKTLTNSWPSLRAYLRGGGGLIQTWGLICEGGRAYSIKKRRWYQSSVLHTELEYKVEKLKYKKLEVMQPRIKNKSELPIGE